MSQSRNSRKLDRRGKGLIVSSVLIALLLSVNVYSYGQQPVTAPGATAENAKKKPTPKILNPAGDRLLLNRPMGMDFDTSGKLYVADLINRRIRIFEPGKEIPTKKTIQCGLLVPWGLALDDSDRIFITDTGVHQIRLISAEGKAKATIGRKGRAPGNFSIPAGVAIDEMRQRLLVADFANHAVQILSFDGTFLGHIGAIGQSGRLGASGRREGEFRGPAGVAVDGMGRIYVTDKENCRVQIFHSTGGFIATFGHPGATAGNFDRPSGICVDEDGAIYVCDTFNSRVQIFEPPFAAALEPTFKVRQVISGKKLTGGPFKLPNACAVSPSGDLYVADTGNNRIVVYPYELIEPQ